MTDLDYSELLDYLADLSINGPTFEVALAALKLQTALISYYGKPL